MFTAVNTSASNVESVFATINIYQHTDEFIQERNRLNVLFVASDSLPLEPATHVPNARNSLLVSVT